MVHTFSTLQVSINITIGNPSPSVLDLTQKFLIMEVWYIAYSYRENHFQPT